MKVRSWGRGKRAVRPEPLSVLEIVAERMRQFGGEWIVAGDRVHGPGRIVIELGDNHTDSPQHIDLNFIFHAGQPNETTIPDCISGVGRTLEQAHRRAVDVWATLTASAVIELLEPRGGYAAHYRGHDPMGFPGWHAITNGVVGWGNGPDPAALQEWALHRRLLADLAPSVSTGLDATRVNGVKVLFGGPDGAETADVRINGTYHDEATRTLLAMDWPRLPEATFARSFVLLAYPET